MTRLELYLLQYVPMSHHWQTGMVVGPKETRKWRISIVKVIDFLGSHWTHATRHSKMSAPKVAHPKSVNAILSEPFSLFSRTTTIPLPYRRRRRRRCRCRCRHLYLNCAPLL